MIYSVTQLDQLWASAEGRRDDPPAELSFAVCNLINVTLHGARRLLADDRRPSEKYAEAQS